MWHPSHVDSLKVAQPPRRFFEREFFNRSCKSSPRYTFGHASPQPVPQNFFVLRFLRLFLGGSGAIHSLLSEAGAGFRAPTLAGRRDDRISSRCGRSRVAKASRHARCQRERCGWRGDVGRTGGARPIAFGWQAQFEAQIHGGCGARHPMVCGQRGAGDGILLRGMDGL
jgi:hypothetical protein